MSLQSVTFKDNVFEFNNQYYRQIHGTAMGTKAAPTYACLYMWDLELDFFNKARIPKSKPSLWYRYIDDIIMIREDSYKELMDFLEELNHFNLHIKFTWTISQTQATFLDVDLKKTKFDDTWIISTKTHIKPTNTHQYVMRNSCHHPGTYKGIVLREVTRHIRNTTFPEFADLDINNLLTKFYQRGYRDKEMQCWIQESAKRQQLEEKQQSKNGNRPNFVTTYTGCHKQLLRIIQDNWHMVREDSELRRRLGQDPPRMVYRRGANIADKLVKARI